MVGVVVLVIICLIFSPLVGLGYFIGAFFSMFLPTAVGGDLVRWYYLQKYGVKRSEVISSILYERFLGVFDRI